MLALKKCHKFLLKLETVSPHDDHEGIEYFVELGSQFRDAKNILFLLKSPQIGLILKRVDELEAKIQDFQRKYPHPSKINPDDRPTILGYKWLLSASFDTIWSDLFSTPDVNTIVNIGWRIFVNGIVLSSFKNRIEELYPIKQDAAVPGVKSYTYSDLIDVLNGMKDEKMISEPDAIDWIDLEKGAAESIIEKLYHFETDIQRVGFLDATFKKFFCDDKDHLLGKAEIEGREGFDNEQVFQYVNNCNNLLWRLFFKVSHAYILYDGIPLLSIIYRNMRSEQPRPGYGCYCKGAIATDSPDDQDKPDFEKILSEIKTLDNKFWKGLPMEKVVEHFSIMTIRKSRNGNVYLTTEQLISFLKKGFLNYPNISKQKINCSTSEKGFVIKRFYELYVIATATYKHPAKKAKFINLFTDCFDNWDKDTIATFFKPNKVKENW